jgi:hypothetical protein
LVEHSALPSTIARLLERSQERYLPTPIKELLHDLLAQGPVRRVQDLDAQLLKTLTGFQPSKALRALCIFFELVARPEAHWPFPLMGSKEIEGYIRGSANPFDFLRHSGVASLLELGAGDLSFASELVELHLPDLRRQNRGLILHCLDRLDRHSGLGGPLHPDPNRMRALQEEAGLTFAYYSSQDMFDLQQLDDQGKLAPRYAIATCWAPATPAFAYEPTRLSSGIIQAELRRTKGAFRHIRYQGELALEVQHGDRALLFPSWKFEIPGPIALLNLLRQRGSLCVLGAVDVQVFWELLAQLLEDPRFRPVDRLFDGETVPEIFGHVHDELARLPIGESISLADLEALRRHLPSAIPSSIMDCESNGAFRYVRISRGAVFPGIPASSTARTFHMMKEEAFPWFLTLIPG